MNEYYYTKDTEKEQWFLDTIRIPAQAFLESDEGHAFVHEHFSSEFEKLLYSQMDEALCRMYLIRYKGTPMYRGEAVKPLSRLGDHIYHMHVDPMQYFGVEESELEFISFEVDPVSYPDMMTRREHELEQIRKELPILQGQNHRCIPRKDRYAAVHQWYNDAATLKTAVDCAVFGPGKYCVNWGDYLRGNPCLKWNDEELDTMLAARISDYIDSLTGKERRAFLKQLAANLGSSYFIHIKTAKLVLTRLFDGTEIEDFYTMMRISADLIRKNLQAQVG